MAHDGLMTPMKVEHWMRPCAWCDTTTRQHVAHKDDMRPFYALCDACLEVYMSQESVWNESGVTGGSGFFWRESKSQPWEFRSWKEVATKPLTRFDAIYLIAKWKTLYKRQYALVQCTDCHAFHPSTGTDGWVGDNCDDCKGVSGEMKCSKCGIFTGANYFMLPSGKTSCQKCHDALVSASLVMEAKKKPLGLGTKGEVRKLPKVNSPMWHDQWSVTGSAKEPYIVSHKTNGSNGSTTEDGWACACMAFTRNTPREDCKHILKVKLFEGMSTAAKAVVPASHAKEYAEFLKLKAKEKRAAAVDGEVKMVGDATGRKFR
jgi:hypothetical protein